MEFNCLKTAKPLHGDSLSYQHFTDIINKFSFHNLNFDKHFVKGYGKKLKENHAGLLKIEKRTERKLLVTFWDQLFSVNSKEISAE